jgi:uncharacterized protein
MQGTGGAARFLAAIAKDIKPAVAARYRIDPSQQMLFGHSFGGLFVLYAMTHDPTLFTHWVAASPSIWFEDRLIAADAMREQLRARLRTISPAAKKRVLLTVGQFEQAADPDFPPPALQVLIERQQIGNAQEYGRWLNSVDGIEAEVHIIANEDHMSVASSAGSRAIRFLFRTR